MEQVRPRLVTFAGKMLGGLARSDLPVGATRELRDPDAVDEDDEDFDEAW